MVYLPRYQYSPSNSLDLCIGKQESKRFPFLLNLPVMTVADLATQLVQARTGDRSARDALILKCLPMVGKVVRGFTKRVQSAYHDADLLESEGNVALIQAVDSLIGSNQTPDDLGVYLRSAIRKHILDANDEWNGHGASASTVQRQRKKYNALVNEYDKLERWRLESTTRWPPPSDSLLTSQADSAQLSD